MKPGDLSPLLSSDSGFHIVRLDESRNSDTGARLVEHHARHILLAPNTVRDDAATRAAAADLKRQLDSGADFAALARQHSNDPGSANLGGDLGWQAKGSFVPEFEAELAAMGTGDVRGPFATSFGWHIVELIERRTKDGGDAQKRERARNAIYQRKAGEEYDLWLRRLRDEAYVEYRLAQKRES
jgi:peptidyl-prolyl cis-trans isomerase SurA